MAMSKAAQRKAELLLKAAGRLELGLSPAPREPSAMSADEERDLMAGLMRGARIVAAGIRNPGSPEGVSLGRAIAGEEGS